MLSPWGDSPQPATEWVNPNPPPFQHAEPEEPKSRARLLIIGTFGGLVLIALIAVGVFVLAGQGKHHNGKPVTKPTPTRTRSINEASTDPGQLISSQFYPATLNVAGRTYRLYSSDSATPCAQTVDNPMSAMVAAQSCTEMLRATYESTDGKTIATVGVAVFDNSSEAESVYSSTHANDYPPSSLWLLPMTTRSAPKFVASGATEGNMKQVGRYLIMTITGYTNGAKPQGSDDPALNQIAADLMNQAETPIRARMSPADKRAYPDAAPTTYPSSLPVPSPTGSPALGGSTS